MVASAGHKLGQIVGDWWEEHVVLPLMVEVAEKLDLFLDNRFVERTCRGGKLLWPDGEGNHVDYDYVLELGGTKDVKGVPVAFIESFWRRGARHSKDKARDDTNKLLPMRATYPTARMLAIAACGEFTEPAREYVRSREVELFYISKSNIVNAFERLELKIDYPDDLPEDQKLALVKRLESALTADVKEKAFESLKFVVGQQAFKSFQAKVASSLAAMPQEIKLYVVTRRGPLVFESTEEVRDFLDSGRDWSGMGGEKDEFIYDVLYTDGAEFTVTTSGLDSLHELHAQVESLEAHMRSVNITW